MMRFSLVLILAVLFGACQKEELRSKIKPTVISDADDAVVPLANDRDLESLINEIGESRFVLIGEGSHGTAEFLRWRVELSRKLIEEKGFTVIAVEGAWAPFYALNAYTSNYADTILSAQDALSYSSNWSMWTWQNDEVYAFGEWLKRYNMVERKNVGIFGIDLSSIRNAMHTVRFEGVRIDPSLAATIMEGYDCLSQYDRPEREYATSTLNGKRDCSPGATRVFDRITELTLIQERRDIAALNMLQNARIVKNAERYYYTSLRSSAASWNIRVRQMIESLEGLMTHYGDNSKIIVWAHNTHVANADAMHLANEGMMTVGKVLKEKYGSSSVYSIGFGSYAGTVTISPEWESMPETVPLLPARSGSLEEIAYRIRPANKILLLNQLRDNPRFSQTLAHRSIGIVYDGKYDERNYIPVTPAELYDAYVFIERTNGLQPRIPIRPRENTAATRSRQ